MDIKQLQALVVDALEDVKAQDIRMYDTMHLTSMFDRVAIASGTSNRQTKALAASVRDKVKSAGGDIISMEGEGTGEWVLVDLGDIVVHIMQPAIRAYYRLEEIWGDKEVNVAAAKRTSTARKTAAKAPASKATADKAPAKKAPAKKAPAKKVATKSGTTTARKTPAKTATKTAVKKVAKKVAAKLPAKTAAKKAVKKAAPRRTAAKGG
jgi:ribosome-associated protein